jgi:hypothetical protein
MITVHPPPIPIPDDIYFDGRNFWHRHPQTRWEMLGIDSLKRLLSVEHALRTTKQNGMASEMDKAIREIERDRKIVAGAPFVHDSRDVVNYNGGLYVNTSLTKPLQPADNGDPDKFPWLHQYFQKVFAEPAERQRAFHDAWFQRLYAAALKGRMEPGQNIVISGPVDQGKSFYALRILGAALGGATDATNYLIGGTAFNGELAKYAIWMVDDKLGGITWQERRRFTGMLKCTAANLILRVEEKHIPAYTLPFIGRVIINCNTDARSQSIIPDLRGGVGDKLMLFRWGNWRPEFKSRAENEKRVADELPYYLCYLLNWPPPPYTKGRERFGVDPYHHPSMVTAAQENSSETRLEEMIGLWREEMDRKEPEWMTVTKLKKELSVEASFRDALKEFSRGRMREALTEMGKDFVLGTRSHAGAEEFLIKGTNDIADPEAWRNGKRK